MNLRGCMGAETPNHGGMISRLAMDVRELLINLDLNDITAIGWSMGASVLWSYLELFADDRIRKLVYVDQSPSQYIGPDWIWD